MTSTVTLLVQRHDKKHLKRTNVSTRTIADTRSLKVLKILAKPHRPQSALAIGPALSFVLSFISVERKKRVLGE